MPDPDLEAALRERALEIRKLRQELKRCATETAEVQGWGGVEANCHPLACHLALGRGSDLRHSGRVVLGWWWWGGGRRCSHLPAKSVPMQP